MKSQLAVSSRHATVAQATKMNGRRIYRCPALSQIFIVHRHVHWLQEQLVYVGSAVGISVFKETGRQLQVTASVHARGAAWTPHTTTRAAGIMALGRLIPGV
jgi:hypothetical protein